LKDDIFWGNLQGILKRGRWEVSLEEASALVAIYQESIKRSKPPEASIVEPPIRPPEKKQKVGEKS
jgi:hypothetical protein